MQGWLGTAAALAVGAAVAFAGGQDSVYWHGWPLFVCCAFVAYAVQWLVFVPSFLAHTEHFFDLTGSLTYLTVIALALWAGTGDDRAGVIALLVAVWAVRLGSFLFSRVRREGADGRFDELKYSFPRFLMTWTIQGLWVLLTLAAGLAAMTATQSVPMGALAWVGVGLWFAGFAIEAAADAQKRAFKRDLRNQGRFITTGLWAWSRHPNYFGEITLWLGVCVDRGGSTFGLAMDHDGLAAVRIRAAEFHQRRTVAGGAGQAALGRRSRIPSVQGAYAGSGAASTARPQLAERG